jgi:hypothetical protein
MGAQPVAVLSEQRPKKETPSPAPGRHKHEEHGGPVDALGLVKLIVLVNTLGIECHSL